MLLNMFPKHTAGRASLCPCLHYRARKDIQIVPIKGSNSTIQRAVSGDVGLPQSRGCPARLAVPDFWERSAGLCQRGNELCQQISNRLEKRRCGKGFLQECNASFQHAVVDDCILGVTGTV